MDVETISSIGHLFSQLGLFPVLLIVAVGVPLALLSRVFSWLMGKGL